CHRRAADREFARRTQPDAGDCADCARRLVSPVTCAGGIGPLGEDIAGREIGREVDRFKPAEPAHQRRLAIDGQGKASEKCEVRGVALSVWLNCRGLHALPMIWWRLDCTRSRMTVLPSLDRAHSL